MVPDRAQSEVTGVLLLVAVGIILAGVISVLALGFGEDATREPVSASIQSEVTANDVIVRHTAGDPLPVGDTVVLLRTPDDRVRVPLSNLGTANTNGDDTFTAGESVRIPHSVADGELTVKVAEENRGAVLHERTYQFTDGIVSKIPNFDSQPPSNWPGNQNDPGATASVSDGGRTVTVRGNKWQQVNFAYNVTRNTMLSFTFESEAEGEIHGIGLEDDTNQNSGRVVRVFGVQNWGVNVSDYGKPYYSIANGTVSYTVPLGEIYEDNGYLGQANTLLIVNDCDGGIGADCSAPSTSEFRNIQVYEDDS